MGTDALASDRERGSTLGPAAPGAFCLCTFILAFARASKSMEGRVLDWDFDGEQETWEAMEKLVDEGLVS